MIANLSVRGRSSFIGFGPSLRGPPRSERRGGSRPSRRGGDLLLDRAEDRRAGAVLHLDPDRVAEAHERRLGRAALDRLDRALLGDARIAARPVLVADGAAADDRAGARVARLAQVRDQLAEVEGHLLAGVAQPGALAVPGAFEIEVEAASIPGAAELVGRHGHRAERRRRLALEEAEALGELGGNEVPE